MFNLFRRNKKEAPKFDPIEIEGGFIPEDFGLKFKKVRRIYIGCGAKGQWANHDWHLMSAHAHCDPNDPWVNCICLGSPRYVLNSDETPTEILMHEYAHILTDYSKYDFSILSPATSADGNVKVQKIFHGKDWQIVMHSLGQRNPQLWSNEPY